MKRELGPVTKLKVQTRNYTKHTDAFCIQIRCFPPSNGKSKSYCISFFTPDYCDADQREESGELIRSVGPQGDIFYKPDIFSVLKIYSQNQWGFKVTIETYRAEDRLVYESRYYMKRRARGYDNDSDNESDNESDNDSVSVSDDEDDDQEPQPKVSKWTKKKKAEEWVAEAQEANTANWISFEIRDEAGVPRLQQREMLSEWLDDNKPSEVNK